MRHDIPRPPDADVLNATRFGNDTLRFLEGLQARYEDAAEVPIPGRAPIVVVTNPELVHDALGRPAEFRRIPASGAAAMIAEQGLVQSEGDRWRQQRSVMGSAFAGDRIRAYADTVGERVAALGEEWEGVAGERRNLHREMTTLTVRVAAEVLLGEDIGRERAEQFHGWLRTAGREFEFSAGSVAPDWLPSRTNAAFREAAEGIRGLAEELIERRRAALADGDDAADMLGLLLRAQENPEVDMPDEQVRDEVATFLIAGHETTALGLTYTWSLLSWHPEARTRVREEAREVVGGETPCHEHVADLGYTQRAFREALRLYPPAWAVFRQASADVRLGDYRVREGSTVIMPQWSIHRDGRYFEDPERFDPDRWARRDPDGVPAYFPFSSGPHACIGRQFSLTGAALVLAGLTRRFDVDVPEDALDGFRVTPTLRPVEGVPATVELADR